MKRNILVLIMCSFCFIQTFSAEEQVVVYSDNKITFTADHVEYDQENNILFGKGNFHLKQDNTELRSDAAEIDLNTKKIIATGNVVLYDKEIELYGDKVRYNMETKKGEIIKGVVYQRPWIIYGPHMEKIDEKKTVSRHARITSCDVRPPHYYLSTSKVFVSIDEYLFAVNTVMWVDDVPIFYMPVFLKSLGDRIYSLDIRPGYSKREGVTVKTTLGFPLSSFLYGKLFLDYFEIKGTGMGSELNYFSDNFKGTLYGYTIKERDTLQDRWNMRGAHWQRLNNYLIVQGNLKFQSDTDFNNTYFKESYDRVVQRLQSDLALTANTRKTTTRIAFTRNDRFDALKGKFVPTSMLAPGITFTTSRIEIMRTRMYYTFNTALNHTFSEADDFYRKSGNSGIALTRTINLSRMTVLKPSIRYEEFWQDRHSKEDLRDLFNGKYTTNVSLRNRITRYIDLDLSHNYAVRMVKNSIKTDIKSLDKGIESNHGRITSFFYISRIASLKLSSGYNFHKDKGEVIKTYKEKIDNVSTDLTVKVTRKIKLSLRDIYDFYPRINVGFSGDIKLWSLRTNWSYSKSNPGALNLYHTLNMQITKKTHVRFGTRYLVSGPKRLNYDRVAFSEQSLAVVRDLHCFEFSMSYTKRGENEEFLFNIQLKSDMQRKKRLFDIDTETDFYPWRS